MTRHIMFIFKVCIFINGEKNMANENKGDPNYPPAEAAPEEPPKTPEPEKKGFFSDDKPLRLSSAEIGEQLEAIVLIPKGSSEPAELAAQTRLSGVSSDLTKLQVEHDALKKQSEELVKTNTELKQKLQTIEDSKRLELATEIADLRIGKGVLSKDKKEDFVKNLAVMDEVQLKTSLEDYKTFIGDKKPTPEVKSPSDPQTAALAAEGDSDEKRQKRMALFGHEDPIEAIMKNNPGYAGEVETVEPLPGSTGGVA